MGSSGWYLCPIITTSGVRPRRYAGVNPAAPGGAPPQSAVEALEKLVIPQLAAVRLPHGPQPGAYEVVERQRIPLQPEAGQPGPRAGGTLDCGAVVIRYRENSQPLDEVYVCQLVIRRLPAGIAWAYPWMFTLRGKQGQLKFDDPRWGMVLHSVRLDENWKASLDATQRARVQAVEQQNRQARHRAVSAQKRHIDALVQQGRQSSARLDQIHSNYERQSAARDASFQNWEQVAVQGVQEANNPFTGERDPVPVGYSHAWVDSTGTRILCPVGVIRITTPTPSLEMACANGGG